MKFSLVSFLVYTAITPAKSMDDLKDRIASTPAQSMFIEGKDQELNGGQIKFVYKQKDKEFNVINRNFKMVMFNSSAPYVHAVSDDTLIKELLDSENYVGTWKTDSRWWSFNIFPLTPGLLSHVDLSFSIIEENM